MHLSRYGAPGAASENFLNGVSEKSVLRGCFNPRGGGALRVAGARVAGRCTARASRFQLLQLHLGIMGEAVGAICCATF